jgi:hypothetical protein
VLCGGSIGRLVQCRCVQTKPNCRSVWPPARCCAGSAGRPDRSVHSELQHGGRLAHQPWRGCAAVTGATREAGRTAVSEEFGYARVLGADWAWQSAYTHYAYPGSERLKSYAHHELATTLAYADLLYLSLAGLRNVRTFGDDRRAGSASRGYLPFRLSVRVRPKWRLCHRENALSAENPSKSATSVRRPLWPSR